MPDKTIIADKLQNMDEFLQLLIDGTANINSVDELLADAEGMLKLKGICMSLLVIGEEVKSLDKHSEKKLLPKYPQIPWSAVMKTRDIIAHHYFDVDAERVFNTLKDDIPPLLAVVKQMRVDWEKPSP
ncbi:MAG: DUF86 domain-containing protein [Fibromonadaceae bacterium]|jgi:uncharacterized protein with HEPN domain|nr:DUF86 domain-containing protein [Fibromonadaceae bacterium]